MTNHSTASDVGGRHGIVPETPTPHGQELDSEFSTHRGKVAVERIFNDLPGGRRPTRGEIAAAAAAGRWSASHRDLPDPLAWADLHTAPDVVHRRIARSAASGHLVSEADEMPWPKGDGDFRRLAWLGPFVKIALVHPRERLSRYRAFCAESMIGTVEQASQSDPRVPRILGSCL